MEGSALCAARFKGTPKYARRIHPLRSQVCDKLGALRQKRGFAMRI